MERTGHRSIEGVWSYKRTSESQQEAHSDILNCKVSRVGNETSVVTSAALPTPIPPVPSSVHPSCTVPTPRSIIQASAQNTNQMQGLSFPSVNFTNCTVHRLYSTVVHFTHFSACIPCCASRPITTLTTVLLHVLSICHHCIIILPCIVIIICIYTCD